MIKINRILCPVDLSDNSVSAIDFAKMLAKDSDAVLVFVYVAPERNRNSKLAQDYFDQMIEQEKKVFYKLIPRDKSVKHEHVYLHGNPGPVIVKTARGCDLIVMGTHGNTGFTRLLMGSVTEYVVRHAECPVMVVKPTDVTRQDPTRYFKSTGKEQFVTDVMQHAAAVQTCQSMNDVENELKKCGASAAPVVNVTGKCIGVVTLTDLEDYRKLAQRRKEKDESVIEQLYETDDYGHRRVGTNDFDRVRRQMSSPVVTIPNRKRCGDALQLLESNPGIHHLVVVDDYDRPIGILHQSDLLEMADGGQAEASADSIGVSD